jgi:TP901 family phage tail tape measure protein
MAQFEVDFSESLGQLAQFQIRLANMGAALDTLEAKAGKSTSASTRLLKSMNAEYDKLEKMLVSAGADAERLGATMQTVRDNVNRLMSGMAAQNLKATVQAQAYNGELAEMGRLLNDTASKNTYSAWQQKTLQLTNKLTGENNYLQASIASMGTVLGKNNAILKANLDFKRSMATADQRAINDGTKLTYTLASLSKEQGSNNVMTQAYIAARKSQITEDFRLDTQLQTLQRTLAGLTGGQQEEITKVQQLINARKQEITETAREDLQLKKLQQTLASLTGGRQEEIARVQTQIAARKRVITESMTEKKVVDELTAAIKREEAQLVRLQAQALLSGTAHARRADALRQEIQEQTRLNKLLGMSTGQLLGFGAAQTKVNLSQELGSQSAAMLRAGLTGLHASVGMYTSATVLAATATYGISAALRDTVVTGAEFYATMSRTKAVMSTGDPEATWLTNAAESSKALEMQVRALGQTTVFTASEVGEGLQQLGMAGLSANEALVALKPSLQLANLANVSMARSADISTNVLMTFGMQANELQGVVDLMATAVNNSNADIEQLANSLSYAGPAAKTAGFSIQDTTAAIETMANSGIKGSRSGSALRRMFTSLLNPTKKGSEVISKYGLDILDAEGNTRSLSNIVNQLSVAMKDLPGPERLAAITNLVGVYASSAVTGLVDNAGQFAEFAKQNQSVAGAGDRMEKIIADNLKFDWKEMLSALEEVQLQAFSQMDGRLRESVAGMSKYILELMEPYKQGTDITGLDRLLVQAQTAAEAFAQALAGIVAYKFATGNVFGALASDASGAADRLSILKQRAEVTSTGLLMMGSSADGTRTKVDMLTLASGRLNGAMGIMSGAAAAGARGLSMLAAAAGAVMRALGWVGLIYGIGSAIWTVFSTNTDNEVIKHRDSVDEVKSSYDELKKSIEETGLARQRAALKTQIGADKQGSKDLAAQIKSQTALIAAGRERGVSEESLKPLEERLEGLKAMVGVYDEKVRESEKSLSQLGSTTNDYVTEAGHQEIRLQNLINLTDQLSRAQGVLAASQGRSGVGLNNLKAQQAVGRLQAEKDAAEQQLRLGTGKLLMTKGNIRPFSETLDNLRADAEASAQEKVYKKVTPLAQQLLDKEKAITEAKAAQAELQTKDDNARQAGLTDQRVGLGLAEASVKNIAKLEADRLVLQGKMSEQEDDLSKARLAASAVTRTDTENLSAYNKELSDINAKLAAAEAPGDGKAMDVKAVTDLYKDQARVLGQIKSLEKKDSKASDRSQKADTREADQDLRVYTALAKKFDAVAASELEMKKGMASMQRLRQSNTITVEQESKAMGELRLAHYLAVEALDKNYLALEKLRDSYSSSPFGSTAEDLAVLNKGLQEGTVNLEEYNRIYGQIRKKNKEEATSGLPTANLSVGEASSSPFTDWVSTEVERASGLKQFDERQKELDASYAIQMAANERDQQTQTEHLNAMQLDAESHATKMLEIDKKYNDNKTSIMLTAGEQQNAVSAQQAQYAEAMSTMAVMAAMGSVQNILGMFASASKDASAGQKAAFVAQKALAVAQIIMYTEIAAAQAMAVSGNPVFGMPLATFIRVTGYANAALVGALAVGQLASGGSSSSSGGSQTQMYDTGGYIPYNRVGVVGEYGPELVQGPAHVTGRGATNGKGGSSSGGGNSLTLAPVISLTMQPNSDVSEASRAQQAREVTTLVKSVVMSTLNEQTRPNGALDAWLRNKK